MSVWQGILQSGLSSKTPILFFFFEKKLFYLLWFIFKHEMKILAPALYLTPQENESSHKCV